MIFGARIEQAREFRGLTQSDLAQRLGVEQASVSMIERGAFSPSTALVDALAAHLGFSSSFFEREPLPGFSLGTLDFRARADTGARAKKQAYQYACLVFEAAVFLSRRLRTPQQRLTLLEGDAEQAARRCRSELGLSPDSPIVNLTDSLERAGIFVFALPDLFPGCDGFSARGVIGSKVVPAIFVSATAPGDRARLTVAHEVGELTLIDMPIGREREKAANRFAGALLMPEDGFRKALVPPVSIQDLAELKRYYGVSIQSALVRAFQLEIISDRRYRSLYKQIGIAGWRTNEPVKIAFEKPRGLSKMAELVYGEQVNIRAFADDLSLPPVFVRQLLSAHASKSDLRGIVKRRRADIIPLAAYAQKNVESKSERFKDAGEA